jgi:hypothetical protein
MVKFDSVLALFAASEHQLRSLVGGWMRAGLMGALMLASCTTATSGPEGLGGRNGGQGGANGGGTGGRIGTGGNNAGSAGNTGGGAGGQTGGGAGTSGGSGGSTAVACPASATFCTGFEQPGMPAGTTYKFNAGPGDWTRDFALDTTVHNTGAASLRVKPGTEAGTSGSAYKMLAAAAPSGRFWVRFYVRSDAAMGEGDPNGDGFHNAFVEAAGSDDTNEPTTLEFAQDVGIAFNFHDNDRWPDGYGRLTTGGTRAYTLPPNAWYCVEISFDSQARAQMLFVDGTQLINATNYPAVADIKSPFTTFRFGFVQFHGPARTMWYDDVAVGPNRMPCF